jgi:succinyl-CoA synthetase beta subunit
LVVRLSGTNEEEGRQILEQNGIRPGANGWHAAQKIVEMSSPLVGRSGPKGRGGGE